MADLTLLPDPTCLHRLQLEAEGKVITATPYRYFVGLGPSTLGEQIKSIGSVVTSPVFIFHQWMGLSESTNYRYSGARKG
jgi:hypothetical protein